MPVIPKHTIDDIAGRMETMGYCASEITVSTSGEYLIEDAMWNIMDLKHADKLHPQVVESTPFLIGHDYCCYLIHIRVLGVAVPIVGVTYLVNDAELGAVLNLPFGFVVQSRIACTQDTETSTTVRIRYTILSHRLLKFMHRAIAWSLRRNFDLLMEDDVPMRLRKMELRRLGFSSAGNPRSFLDSMNIGLNNIRFDTKSMPHPGRRKREQVALSDLAPGTKALAELTPEKSFLILKEKDGVFVFPSYCSHEGADLNGAPFREGHVICPWHGRRVRPLCRFDANPVAGQPVVRQRLEDPDVEITCDGRNLNLSEVDH